MWLILTDQGDPDGPWLASGLASRGLDPVETITVDQLLGATRLSHRVGAEGAHFSAKLADGRTFDSRQVLGTINRISYVPADPTIAPDDTDYVVMEGNAAVLSMLTSLPGPVFNPASPSGLSGRWRQPSQWMALAGRAGLAHRRFDWSTRPADSWVHQAPTVITVGDEIVDTGVAPEVLDGCLRLARLSRTPMLGVRFDIDGTGRHVFVGADTRPNLRLIGEPLLDALTYVFERSRQGARS